MEAEHLRHKKFPFRHKKAALFVIDMQDYFTNKKSHAFIPSSAAIIPKINRLVQAFYRARRPVIFTRHIDVDPNNLMSRWWGERLEETNPLSQLNKKLDTSYGITIIKHQYDAFMNTGLEEMLRKGDTEQAVITGVVSHICCETTARAAFMRDFETFFVTDATAAYNPEHHRASIFNLAHAFAVPVKCEELLSSPLKGEVGWG